MAFEITKLKCTKSPLVQLEKEVAVELGVILSQNQFNIVYNVLSFGIAAMLAGFIGFILLRDQLKENTVQLLHLGRS